MAPTEIITYPNYKSPEEEGKFLIPNEVGLPRTFQYLAEYSIPGNIVSVGFARGLDMLVNTQEKNALHIVDHDRQVLLANKLACVVAARHIQQQGKFKDSAQFISYFDPNNIDSTIQLIESDFNTEDIPKIRTILNSSFENDQPRLLTHLQFTSRTSSIIPGYTSWIEPDNLAEIAEIYDQGNIEFHLIDLTNSHDVSLFMSRIISNSGPESPPVPISIIDFSNITTNLGTEEELDQLFKGFGVNKKISSPILTADTLILRTTLLGSGDPLPTEYSEDEAPLQQWHENWIYVIQTLEDLQNEIDTYGTDPKVLDYRATAQQPYRNPLWEPLVVEEDGGVVLIGIQNSILKKVLNMLLPRAVKRLQYRNK